MKKETKKDGKRAPLQSWALVLLSAMHRQTALPCGQLHDWKLNPTVFTIT